MRWDGVGFYCGECYSLVRVVALGSWVAVAKDWLGPATGPRIPMEGIKSTSLVYGFEEVGFACDCIVDSHAT